MIIKVKSDNFFNYENNYSNYKKIIRKKVKLSSSTSKKLLSFFYPIHLSYSISESLNLKQS